MPSDEFVRSVERYARSAYWDKPKDKVAAWVENQTAVRKTGALTYLEAMQLVVSGRSVTRTGWGILHAIMAMKEAFDDDYYGCNREPSIFTEGQSVWDWEYDNADGSRGGFGEIYDPTPEDRAATDWMEYQIPEEWEYECN
jgi:hypothetical protein